MHSDPSLLVQTGEGDATGFCCIPWRRRVHWLPVATLAGASSPSLVSTLCSPRYFVRQGGDGVAHCTDGPGTRQVPAGAVVLMEVTRADGGKSQLKNLHRPGYS